MSRNYQQSAAGRRGETPRHHLSIHPWPASRPAATRPGKRASIFDDCRTASEIKARLDTLNALFWLGRGLE